MDVIDWLMCRAAVPKEQGKEGGGEGSCDGLWGWFWWQVPWNVDHSVKMTSNDHFAQRSTASGPAYPALPICFASLIALCAALVFPLRATQLLILAGAAGFSPDQVYLMWFSLICVVVGEMWIDFVAVPVNTGPPPSRAAVVRVPVFTPVFSPKPKPKPTTSQFKDLFKSM